MVSDLNAPQYYRDNRIGIIELQDEYENSILMTKMKSNRSGNFQRDLWIAAEDNRELIITIEKCLLLSDNFTGSTTCP